MRKLNVGSLFTGIGAWEKALLDLNVEFELKFFCEFDKYAVQSYCAMYSESEEKNLEDITKVDVETVPDIDVLFYSPPCQAFSVAGQQKGFDDKRGVLFFDALKVIEAKKPRLCIMENVKGLTGKKFKDEFADMLQSLEDLGYKNSWKVLNAKDYGIPQNRERVFVVSLLSGEEFEFPEGEELKLRLKDMLEDDVDEKYYISEEKTRKFFENNPEVLERLNTNIGEIRKVGQISSKGSQAGTLYSTEGLSPTICAGTHGYAIGNILEPKIVVEPVCGAIRGRYKVDGVRQDHKMKTAGLTTQQLELRDDGLTNTITTVQKDNMLLEPKMKCIEYKENVRVRKYEVDISLLKECLKDHKTSSQFTNKEISERLNIKKTTVEHWFRNDNCFSIPEPSVWIELKELLDITTDEFDKSIMEFEEREGVFEKADRCYLDEGIFSSILTGNNDKIVESLNFRIRRLTPTECWRLQGFKDEDIQKCIDAGISNTQLYKQAGNSITVNVPKAILKKLFKL